MTVQPQSRSLARILLAIVVVASMLLATASSATAGDQFDDVPDGHPFHDEIAWMVDQAVTEGFEDNTFKPGRDVTRQAYMAFLYRMAGEPTWARCDSTQFGDVDDAHPFCTEITWGAVMGITEGFDDGTFKPARVVSRQAAAAFQYRSIAEAPASHSSSFADVSTSHPFHDEIAWMDGEGLAEGYDDGTYGPDDAVTRQAAAAFLFRQDAAGFTVATGNQTFAVVPVHETYLPDNGERDYTVDTADAQTVTIELAVCANVDVTDGTVGFEVDSSGTDDVAAFGQTDATISDVVADGVPHTGTGTGESITVNGGELTFTLDGANTPECVVPVVSEDQDDDGLDVQPDGRPTEPFGVGGSTIFSDVTGLELTSDVSANPFGTDHQVTATLLGGDVDGDGDPDALALTGQEIDFTVTRYQNSSNRQLDCGMNAVGGSTVIEATVTIDENGVAVLDYTGPDDPDTSTEGDALYDCIVAEWDGSGAYAGQGPEDATVTKDWLDGEGVPTNLELTQDEADNPVDTDHTVTATVTDQFGEPVEGVDVRFDIDRDDGTDYTFTRTTNAAGEAVLTYHGPDDPAVDTITATALDDEGEDTEASDSVTKTWSSSG